MKQDLNKLQVWVELSGGWLDAQELCERKFPEFASKIHFKKPAGYYTKEGIGTAKVYKELIELSDKLNNICEIKVFENLNEEGKEFFDDKDDEGEEIDVVPCRENDDYEYDNNLVDLRQYGYAIDVVIGTNTYQLEHCNADVKIILRNYKYHTRYMNEVAGTDILVADNWIEIADTLEFIYKNRELFRTDIDTNIYYNEDQIKDLPKGRIQLAWDENDK